MTTMRTLSLSLLSLVLVAACSKSEEASKADTTPKNAGSAAATISSAGAAASAAPATSAGATALAADANGALPLAWKLANMPNERVAVSIVVGEQTIPLGSLDAMSDDAPGTVATCSMKNAGTTSSKLECGATPHFNFYTAKISGGALVVTLTDGVDVGPSPDSTQGVSEVLRRATTATTLKATGPAPAGLYGNCRPGWVQKGADQPCMRQCLKGTECKGQDTCQMVTVKGTDGDHKVHACVPAGAK